MRVIFSEISSYIFVLGSCVSNYRRGLRPNVVQVSGLINRNRCLHEFTGNSYILYGLCVQVYICVCMYVCVYVCVCMCVCIYVCAYRRKGFQQNFRL